MQTTYKEIVSKIKSQTKIDNFRDGMLAAHFLCRPLSRPCSVWFIHHNVKPNQITLLMIIFGIIGSILFALPYALTKVLGYLFWILWFTMDLSDGQVARFTKNFSKYGTEMDYMAHLIDHPLMNIAIWLSFIEMNIINPIILSAVFIIWISMELISRNITSFYRYDYILYNKTRNDKPKQIQGWLKYLWGNILLYPTYIVCFSWLIIVDFYLKIGFSLIFTVIWVTLFLLMFIRNVYKTVMKFYKG